jgi:hypothetical protein
MALRSAARRAAHVLRSIFAETDPMMAINGYPTLAGICRERARRT